MAEQWWEWHLTPSGWREGQYLDPLGRVAGEAAPDDAVLTLRRYAEDPSGHLKEHSETRHGSEAAVRYLQEKYGREPPRI